MSTIKFERGGETIELGVFRWRDRVRPTLCLCRRANIEVMASFLSDDHAQRFERALERIIVMSESANKDGAT